MQASASTEGWKADMEQRISEVPNTRAVHRWLADKADLTSMTEWLARKADIDEVQAHINVRANQQVQQLAIAPPPHVPNLVQKQEQKVRLAFPTVVWAKCLVLPKVYLLSSNSQSGILCVATNMPLSWLKCLSVEISAMHTAQPG